MIELRKLADSLSNELHISDSDYFNRKFIDFLEDNRWFGAVVKWKNECLYVDLEVVDIIRMRAAMYFNNCELDTKEKVRLLKDMFRKRFPDSFPKIIRFFEEFMFSESIVYSLLDFLLTYLKKDFCIMTDADVEELIEDIFIDLSKYNGDIFTFFLSWLKDSYVTCYHNDYVMKQRKSEASGTQAYDSDEYLELIYYLFNEEYITDNDMYTKAADSKNFADTWLFLSMHFICSLRRTDMERIYHPRLTMSPDQVLQKISSGCFDEKDARLTLYSITWRLNNLPLQPSKTASRQGIGSVKFCVPESIEVHIGMLFALCEAHRLLAGIPDETPLIRCISKYDNISRYMGEEIGELFLEADFKSRAANKSYLQSIFLFADNILDNTDDELNMKGYILAALARSHKGSYGEFAHTTSVYLKDAAFSGLTPEFVAMELFERGVLSFIPSMLLKMISGEHFYRLSIDKQTELIKVLDMTPYEIENVVKLSECSNRNAQTLIAKVIGKDNKREEILKILHRIGNGTAVSKQDECLCLMTALHKPCPYPDRCQCIGCENEISTKSTVFLLISEYNRLRELYHGTDNKQSKMKYETILKQQVLPALDEILYCVNEQYGHKALEMLEAIIKENVS